MNNPTKKLRTAIKILAKKAVQNPDTLKPETSVDTSSIINALITSKKNPKLNMVSGMVNRMTMGLIIALAKPSSSAAISSDFLLVNEMPWNIKPATHSDRAVIPQWARNSIMLFVMWNVTQAMYHLKINCAAHIIN